LKKLVGFALLSLGLLAALLALLDLFAKAYTEDQIGQAITHKSTTIGYAKANIDSFPFTGKLLFEGRVEHVEIKLSKLTGVADVIDELDLRIDGLEMDKRALLGRQNVEIKKVDKVIVSAILGSARLQALANRFGALLAFDKDKLTVNGVPVAVAVEGDQLVLSAPGLPALRVPIPASSADLLPCTPSTSITKDGIALTCQTTRLPKIVIDAIGSIDLKKELSG
jgi:hypothetical protein